MRPSSTKIGLIPSSSISSCLGHSPYYGKGDVRERMKISCIFLTPNIKFEFSKMYQITSNKKMLLCEFQSLRVYDVLEALTIKLVRISLR